MISERFKRGRIWRIQVAEKENYQLSKKIAEYALSKKALDVRIMHLFQVTSMTDYFVVCHGESELQVKAIADAIQEGLKKEGERVWHKEGYTHSNWVLLDYVDVVVHIFNKESRLFYALERLWGDAEIETIGDTV